MNHQTYQPQKALYLKHKPLGTPEYEQPLLAGETYRILMAYVDEHEDPGNCAGENTDPEAAHGPVDEVFAADPPRDQFIEIDEAIEGPGGKVPSREPAVPHGLVPGCLEKVPDGGVVVCGPF